MPTTTATEYQTSSSSVVSMAFPGASILSLRYNQVQVVSMEHGQEQDLRDLDLFQSHVAGRLQSLLSSSDQPDHGVLTVSFLQKLMDAFLSWEEEFRSLIVSMVARNPGLVARPPVERALSDLLDRTVKSLDILNAVTDSVHSLQHWNRHADIAASALIGSRHRQIPIGDGQLGRARKALDKMLNVGGSSRSDGNRTERAWSFGRSSRSLSGSAGRGWSAVRQLHAMAASLSSPRGGAEGGGAAGAALGLAVYTMSSLLVFTMWTLVAAFPSQERGGHGHGGGVAAVVAPPRQVVWALAMVRIQERIGEEVGKRGRKGVGALAEMLGVEKCGKELMEVVTTAVGGGGGGVVQKAVALAEANKVMEEGLGPFERQVREVFHRVVSSRAEVVRCLDQSNQSAAAGAAAVSSLVL